MSLMATRGALATGVITLALALTGCGGGGSSGGGGSTATESGNVSVAVTDVPLAQLQTLTLDVSAITLKGAGNTADAAIFPAGTGTSSVTIDLLALQGLNQLLANVAVPTGTYYGIEFTYSNPQATSVAGVAQTVNNAGPTILGVFGPPLNVSANSNQAVQVDIDLSRSVIDQGNDTIFLAPAALVRVLGAGQGVPLQSVRGVVVAIDTAADEFVMALRFRGGAAAGPGRVRVINSPNTVFNDGNGTTVTGMTAASLTQGDLVAVDGLLTRQGVEADEVRLVQTGQGPTPAPAPPAVVQLTGTILAVNSTASTLSVRVGRAFAPSGATAPARFSDVTVNVGANTQLFRGRNAVTLADLAQGNRVEVLGALNNQAVDARSISERPSLVVGTVTAVTGAGPVTVSFTPSSVNQIPAANLAFLPSSLSVDVPSFVAPSVGDTFRVVAYFDGTATLSARGLPSNIIGPAPPIPPQPQPAQRTLVGIPAPNTTATLSNGEIDLQLQLGGPSSPVVPVTVTSAAAKLELQPGTAPMTITAQEAVNLLNGGTVQVVEVEGANATNTAFVADVSLVLVTSTSTTPPAPSPTPLPSPTPSDHLVGLVGNTATINNAGQIEFTMVPPFPAPNVTPIPVTVQTGARLVVLSPFAPPQTVTAAQAVSLLNGGQIQAVEVVGTFDPATGFDASVALRIFQ